MNRDVRARREPTVLVRIAIHEVVEEVVPDPAVREQRVPPCPARRSRRSWIRAASPRSGTRGGRASLTRRATRTPRVPSSVPYPAASSPRPQLVDRGRCRTRVVIVDDEEPKRAPVRGELLDVEDAQSMAGEDPFRGEQRVVREMLVVDRVELVLLDEADEVRDLDRQDARGASRMRSAAVKSLRSGTCAKTLFATTRSAGPSRVTISWASPVVRNSASVGMPAASARRGDVPRRFDPQYRDAARDQVTEEISVVARDLDDARRRSEPEPLDDRVDIAAGMVDPAVRVRREVEVLPEDVLGRDVRGKLDEQARPADPYVEGVEALGFGEPVGGQEVLARRRHAEIDEDVLERRPARATAKRTRPPAGGAGMSPMERSTSVS